MRQVELSFPQNHYVMGDSSSLKNSVVRRHDTKVDNDTWLVINIITRFITTIIVIIIIIIIIIIVIVIIIIIIIIIILNNNISVFISAALTFSWELSTKQTGIR